MSQNLLFGLPIPVALALLALVLILLAVARTLLALRKPAPVRAPAQLPRQAPQPAPRHYPEAPYKLEGQMPLRAGRLEVVPHAGREPANR